MRDSFDREIDYMRISVTDRCNLRCRYCMPEGGIRTIPMPELLTYEEIARVCQIGVGLGIRKIRLTGGEPLVRTDLPKLIAMISRIPGIERVSMTTNGILLPKYLPELTAAGLHGVNISLDTLNPDMFCRITRVDALQKVLDSIRAIQSHTSDWNTSLPAPDHQREKILFATDSPWAGQKEFVALLQKMPLAEEEKEQILGGNACRLLGI